MINRKLVVAVTIKQALEQTGAYDVHPFTAPKAALEYLRDHPQDIAVVDYEPNAAGDQVVQQLRQTQPDLAIIITPRPPNAEAVTQRLRIQGIVDAPFTARDLIPVIRQALEQPIPPPPPRERRRPAPPPEPAQTRPSGDEAEPLAIGPMRTLGRTPTGDLQEKQRDADDDLPAPVDDFSLGSEPAQTRLFGEEQLDLPSPPVELGTRILDADQLPEEEMFGPGTQLPGDQPPSGQTRLFDEAEDSSPPQTPRHPAQTRIFDEDEDFSLPQTPWRPAQTRIFDEEDFEEPALPPNLPEFSPLASVLQSFDFDAEIDDQDTPAVPLDDSEAMRQYLATTDRSLTGSGFDDILSAIDPEDAVREEKPRSDRADFEDLVASMRGSDAHTPLPDRQQQMLDFILTTGMASLLSEIEKVKTGPLSQPEAPPRPESRETFQKLAEEEPPMPTLEESGTIGDLMVGISDRSFRNVLSLLRGEEVEEITSAEEPPASVMADFFAPPTLPEEPPPSRPPRRRPAEPKAPRYDFDYLPEDESGSESVAQVVLRAALEPPPTGLPATVDQLIQDIETRLAMHRLRIHPLPSWGMDTEAFRALSETGVMEPEFLPEQFTTGVMIPPTLPELETPPEAGDLTTQPSSAVQEQVQGALASDVDTLRDTYDEAAAPAGALETGDETAPGLPDLQSLFADVLEVAPPDDELEITETSPASVSWLENLVEAPAALLPEFPEIPEPEPPAWPEEQALPEAALPETPFELQPAVPADWLPDISPEPTWHEQDTREVTPDEPASLFTEEMPFETEPAGLEFLSGLDALADVAPPAEPDVIQDSWDEPAETEAVYEQEAWPETPPAEAAIAEGAADMEAAGHAEDHNAYLAQLALNLTQASLESSAEGTVLTRDDEIIAFAGDLAPEDIQGIREMIADDWQAGSGGARFRFVTLPSGGKEYMLYSIQTDGSLTLSMIFASTTPLRVIRKQAQRLAQALQTIPEMATETARTDADESALAVVSPAADELETVSVIPYAFVWAVRDPRQRLDERMRPALISGMTTQLTEKRWGIHRLDISDEYIYLLADVPGSTPPHELIRDLKRRSADIIHAQNLDLTPDLMWADSYLVLTPGRELQPEEIQDFINFQRML